MIFSGCIGDSRYSLQSYEYLKKHIPSDLNKTGMSKPIILLGDTQEHEDFGTATDDSKRLIDTFVTDVTRRTVQANLNSIEIMKSILKKNTEVPVIHLGDFLDVSCHDEFTRAMNVLSTHDKWIIMLGNHDGYYLGNFLKKNNTATPWAKQCDSGRFYKNLNYEEPKVDNYEHALLMEINEYQKENQAKKESRAKTGHVRSYNKSTVIERYLSTLFRKNKELSLSMDSHYDKLFDQNHTFHNKQFDSNDINYSIKKDKENENKIHRVIDYSSNKNTFIKKIYAYINQCKKKSNLGNCNPQKSFLLQKVSLEENKIELILLDTSVYKKPYSSSPIWKVVENQNKLAGRVGNLTGDLEFNQIKVLERWLQENKEKNITTIFAGHHPLETVDELKSFFENTFKSKPVFYISAHTHQGFWKKWDNSITELNVGSLIDAPIHYRTLQVKKIEDDRLEILSQLKEFNLTNIGKLIGNNCKDAWTNYSDYSHAHPENQESDYPYTFNKWDSQHLKILPYLSYYLKLLETKEIKDSEYDFNLTILTGSTPKKRHSGSTPKKRHFNKSTLITYLDNSISNFKKRLKNKNATLNNEKSCITKVKDGDLSTRSCSRLLYTLKKNEKEIFKDFNQTFLNNYRVCTALNAIIIDANTSKMDVEIENSVIEIDTKGYREVNKLFELELENRQIKHMVVD